MTTDCLTIKVNVELDLYTLNLNRHNLLPEGMEKLQNEITKLVSKHLNEDIIHFMTTVETNMDVAMNYKEQQQSKHDDVDVRLKKRLKEIEEEECAGHLWEDLRDGNRQCSLCDEMDFTG